MTIALFDLPHREARDLLAATDAPVFLAMNPVEFHGPHLSLHNDRLVTAGLSRDLHAALADGDDNVPFIVAGELELGVEPTSGRGSRHARYRDARRILLEACRALAELGARRVVIDTFHGAALHNLAIDDAVRALEAEGVRAFAPMAVALEVMLSPDRALLDPAVALAPCADEAERAALRRSLPFDFHAGWVETSIALHYAPASVSDAHRALAPAPPLGRDRAFAALHGVAHRLGAARASLELDFVATAATWTRQRPFLGYTGMPHLATREAGACLAGLFVARYAEAARGVLERGEPAPRPPFSWMRWATLGGRLDTTRVPVAHVRE